MKAVTLYTLVIISPFLVTAFGSNAIAQPGNVNDISSLSTTPAGCQIHGDGLPDPNCTPGEANPRVSQSNIHSTICVPGWSAKERETYAPRTYTDPLKTKLMKSYGLDPTNRANYELDHLIAIEDGGDPHSVNNLWPQPYDIQENARIKDAFEHYLHRQVCNGSISLSDAQRELSQDWIANLMNDQSASDFAAAMIPKNGGSFNSFNPLAEDMTDEDDNAK